MTTRNAVRPLGTPWLGQEMPPEVVVGKTPRDVPLVVVLGGHSRRSGGLAFSTKAALTELRDDIDHILRLWPDD